MKSCSASLAVTPHSRQEHTDTLELDELEAAIEQMMEARRSSEQRLRELRTKLGEERNLCNQTQRAAAQALTAVLRNHAS